MLVRRFQKRNASIVVEANGEVLFAPGTTLSAWKTRFSNTLSAEVVKAAPANGHSNPMRTLRPHHGPETLKQSITSSTSTRITRGGGRFYIATGSRAPYATFVDQGTNGQDAKVLPPWAFGSPSLYWAKAVVPAPGGEWRPLGPVHVRGQRAQNFFDAGLASAFRIMRMRSINVPGAGISGMASALESTPTSLIDLVTSSKEQAYTPSFAAWVEWRDEAFGAGKDFRGNSFRSPRRNRRSAEAHARRAEIRATKQRLKEHRRAQNKERQRDRGRIAMAKINQAKSLKKADQTKAGAHRLTRSQDERRVRDLAIKRFGADSIASILYENGQWDVSVFVKVEGRASNTIKLFHLKAKS